MARRLPWLILLLAVAGAVWMLLGHAGFLESADEIARDAADGGGARTGGEEDWDEAWDAAPRLIGRGSSAAGDGYLHADPAGPGGGGRSGAAAANERLPVAGVRFGGVVKGTDGGPADEVQVLLRRRGAEGTLLEQTTDANGRFRTEVAPGRYDIAIRGAGLGSLNLPDYLVDGATGVDVEFTLLPAHRLEVTVTRKGQALADVDVAAQPRQGIGGEGAKTDGGGVAIFENLAAGSYRVIASLATNETIQRNLELRRDEALKLELPPGVLVHGTIENEDEGGPVGDATVAAWIRGPGGTWITVSSQTEPDGRYEMQVPAGAVARFEVAADEFAAWPERKDINKVRKLLSGVARGRETRLDVKLTRGLAVGGLVTDQDDEPVPGLELSFKPRRGAGRSVRTGEDGRYRIGGMTRQRYDVAVLTEGWFSEQALIVAVPALEPGSVHPYDVKVRMTIAVQGEVLHHDKSPAAGARAWVTGGGRLLRAAHDAGRDLETFTDSRGFWRITDLPANQGVVVRAALGTLEATPRGIRTDDLPDKPIRLVLAPTVSLKGTVLDIATRRPVASARVTLRPTGPPGGRTPRTATTDTEGTFEVFELIPGVWEITPLKGGYLTAEALSRDLRDAETPAEVTLYLDPGLAIAGTVVDLHGQGVNRARISISGTTNSGKRFSRSTLTDERGGFRMTGFESGDYRLVARRSGFRNGTLTGLRGGEERLTVELRPRP